MVNDDAPTHSIVHLRSPYEQIPQSLPQIRRPPPLKNTSHLSDRENGRCGHWKVFQTRRSMESPRSVLPTTPPTIAKIMSRRVISVTMDDFLGKIQELFHHHHFHHLLVVEQRTLVGVISDRDLLKALSPNIGTWSETERDRATLHKRAHQIMSRNPVTAHTDSSIDAAAQLMIEKNISCLPITTKEGILEGILSWKDILKALVGAPRTTI